jgi:hypothetical protein
MRGGDGEDDDARDAARTAAIDAIVAMLPTRVPYVAAKRRNDVCPICQELLNVKSTVLLSESCSHVIHPRCAAEHFFVGQRRGIVPDDLKCPYKCGTFLTTR